MEATILAMGTSMLLGAAGGVWGLVVALQQNKRPSQPPVVVDLEQLPDKIAPVFAQAVANIKLEHAKLPPLEMPEPKWAEDVSLDLEMVGEVIERLDAAMRKVWAPELAKLVGEIGRMNARLDETAAQPVIEFASLEKKLEGIARQLGEAVDPLVDLPSRLTQALESRPPIVVMRGGGPNAGGGGGGSSSPPPPPKRLSAPTPRAAPVPMPPTPSIPAPYVAGNIVVPTGPPSNLLTLIQQQLQPNCPGSATELLLSAEEAVYVGAASAIGGPLSATNYGYELTPGSAPRIYRSTFPGNSTPLGELQLFAAAAATVHVEVQS